MRTLKNAIETERIAHAYLFVGPRGTGKTTTARIFAKALNAEGGPKVNPDDNSAIAQAILSGSCMDVIEIDGASNNSVDDVRSLREECQYSPAEGNFKVYIIDEVHMLSTQAWNALLKTLEEPPAHVKFIFATTEAHKVLATVVSRCQRFEFRPISDARIVERLQQIAQAEGISVDDAALRNVARLADGGMRDAQSILDQLISFCGTNITEADVLDVYGLTSEENIQKIAAAMAQADYETLFNTVEQLASEGRDLYRILQDLQAHVRSAMIRAIQAGGHSDELGAPMNTENLSRMLDALQQGDSQVRHGLSQRVNFEVALLRAVDQSRTRAIDSVIKELSNVAAGLPQEAGQKKIGPSRPAEEPERSILPKAVPRRASVFSVPQKIAAVPATAEPNESSEMAAIAPGPEARVAPLPEEIVETGPDEVPDDVLEAQAAPTVGSAADTGIAAAPESTATGDNAPPPKRRSWGPYSPEFQAAMEKIDPATLKALDELLRAEFRELVELDPEKLLK